MSGWTQNSTGTIAMPDGEGAVAPEVAQFLADDGPDPSAVDAHPSRAGFILVDQLEVDVLERVV